MDYTIVICSHKRVRTLKEKSLATLERYQIPKEKIFIFVAPQELEEYQTAFPEYTVVKGELGLCHNRNAATAYFPPDVCLFFMDDDIKGYKVRSPDNRLIDLSDLDSFIQKGFLESQQRKCSLWGLYPVANAKWLKNSYSSGLVFCYGCSFGLWNRKDILIELNYKEDFERCLKFYERDGSVLRLNWVAPVQSYCRGTGGLNLTRTLDKERAECEALKKMFPQWVNYSAVIKKNKINITFPRRLAKTEATHEN
jgi:hypothetical protein